MGTGIAEKDIDNENVFVGANEKISEASLSIHNYDHITYRVGEMLGMCD